MILYIYTEVFIFRNMNNLKKKKEIHNHRTTLSYKHHVVNNSMWYSKISRPLKAIKLLLILNLKLKKVISFLKKDKKRLICEKWFWNIWATNRTSASGWHLLTMIKNSTDDNGKTPLIVGLFFPFKNVYSWYWTS